MFAVPGAVQDPRGQGTNGLIRDGAIITESADDVLAVLENMPQSSPRNFHTPDTITPSTRPVEAEGNERHAVTRALGPAPAPVDDVIRLSGVSPQTVAQVLLELDLAGRLERHAGGRVSLLAGD